MNNEQNNIPSSIKDNRKRGSVGNFLKEEIGNGNNLSVVSAYFTIYAYNKLRDKLDNIENLNFLFGEPAFIKTVDPEGKNYKEFKIEDDKIIWIELNNKAKFALCKDETYLLNSAYFLIPPEKIGIKYLLSLLNSCVLEFYIKIIAVTSGMGTIGWINNYVKKFPIPQIPSQQQLPFEIIVDCILFAKENNMKTEASTFESVIDGMVFNLYFPDHMKERKIDVLQFAEKDIEEVMQGKEFEKLSDSQKERVITELHTSLERPQQRSSQTDE